MARTMIDQSVRDSELPCGLEYDLRKRQQNSLERSPRDSKGRYVSESCGTRVRQVPRATSMKYGELLPISHINL
jgi:hypothetical protein